MFRFDWVLVDVNLYLFIHICSTSGPCQNLTFGALQQLFGWCMTNSLHHLLYWGLHLFKSGHSCPSDGLDTWSLYYCHVLLNSLSNILCTYGMIQCLNVTGVCEGPKSQLLQMQRIGYDSCEAEEMWVMCVYQRECVWVRETRSKT